MRGKRNHHTENWLLLRLSQVFGSSKFVRLITPFPDVDHLHGRLVEVGRQHSPFPAALLRCRLYRVMADVSYLLGDDDIRTVLQNSGELGKILDFVLSIASEERSGGWAKLLCSAPPPVPSLHVFSLVHRCLCAVGLYLRFAFSLQWHVHLCLLLSTCYYLWLTPVTHLPISVEWLHSYFSLSCPPCVSSSQMGSLSWHSSHSMCERLFKLAQ